LKRVSAFAQGYGGQGGRKYTEADVSAFSREKKFSPSPRTIYPCRKQRVLFCTFAVDYSVFSAEMELNSISAEDFLCFSLQNSLKISKYRLYWN
jgi:hypothetical protein